MRLPNVDIINAFTDIDEMMQFGHGPIMLLSPQRMFEMGQFYQWAETLINNDEIDMDGSTDVPNDFDWVVGETQSW
jgi:hypothetical protein